mgnify:FL=1
MCSCPMHHDCKHVAAVLLQVLADEAQAWRSIALVQSPELVPPPLSHPVSAWLGGLMTAIQTGTEDYPPTIQQRIWYVLMEGAQVAPVSLRLRKDGTPGDARPYNPASAVSAAPAKFLRPSDRHSLRALRSMADGRGPAAEGSAAG